MRADAERNRTLILDSARRLFETEGPDVSNRRISRDAGVGVATLQRHFPSRVALIEAALRAHVDECLEAITHTLSIREPEDALRTLFAYVLTLRASSAAVNRALLSYDTHSAPFETERRKSRQVALALTARARSQGVLRPSRDERDVLAALHVLTSIPRRDHASAELAERVANTLLGGLLSESASLGVLRGNAMDTD